MNIKEIHSVYFIGIGGIGMSALASYFLALDKKVAGYDKTPSEITGQLEKKGALISFEDTKSSIPKSFSKLKNTLVVYTPAISNENQILTYFQSKTTLYKRAEVLGMITKSSKCLAVAGTHGKTTTSSILGHIMKVCGTNATSFLGGIAEGYHSNLILGGDKISVVEADEFDRSFLQLAPNWACVTSMDADHLDIYGQKDALEAAFFEFAYQVEHPVIVYEELPLDGITYGFSEKANYRAMNVRIEHGTYIFDVMAPYDAISNIKVNLPGKHNVLNTLAALALAHEFGLPLSDIANAIGTFKGIQRRFSYKIKRKDFVLIDDYAHHPTEINAVADAVL